MDEIEIKQKLRKEIEAITGDEVIHKRPEMSLKFESWIAQRQNRVGKAKYLYLTLLCE